MHDQANHTHNSQHSSRRRPQSFEEGNSCMSRLEMEERQQRQQKHGAMDTKWDAADIDKVSSEWRRIGQKRRAFLLENDRRRGGTNFDLNISCNVSRYFKVAHRTWELFHKMYLEGEDLEEAYVMGHRMVSFLTECLPQHPGFRRPAVVDLRKRSQRELELLKKCLEDLAMRIDEEQCDRFADEFDPFVDEDSDSDCEEVAESLSGDWVGFGSWKEDARKLHSPTTETVATTGTDSLEEFDFSSSDEGMPERRLEYPDADDTPTPLFSMELSTAFLERVAQEDVEYETDSDAADSWAQGPDESYAPSASSGHGVTCDPARIAFREILNRASEFKLLSPIRESDRSTPLLEKDNVRRPDPPAQRSLPNRPEVRKEPEGESYKHSKHPTSQAARELAIESEIQRFLDSSLDVDPDCFFESSLSRVKEKELESSGFNANVGGPSFGSLDIATARKNEAFFREGDVLLQSNGWVSFD